MASSNYYPPLHSTPTPAPSPEVSAENDDSDDDPGALAQAIDETLDACDAAWRAGQTGTARALLTSAMAAVDALLAALGVDDPDEVGPGPG